MIPETLIEIIRDSRPDSLHFFRNGGCWHFFTLLKRVFPQSKPYYNHILGHILVDIDGKMYDIGGRVYDTKGYGPAERHVVKGAHRWMARQIKCKII